MNWNVSSVLLIVAIYGFVDGTAILACVNNWVGYYCQLLKQLWELQYVFHEQHYRKHAKIELVYYS